MKRLRKVFTLTAVLLVMAAALYQFNIPVEAYEQKLGTVTSDTSLYETASSSASVVMSLTSGQSVVVNNEVTGTDGAIWYQLYVDNTETGYVPSGVVTVSTSGTGTTEADVLTTTTTTTVTTGTITASSVNVRASATTTSTAVTTLSNGATFTVLAQETGDDGYVWYQVEFEQNGGTVYGYIRSDLASITTEEVEVTVDDPSITQEEQTSNETESEAPYRIVSQETAEGELVWYLVEDGSSSGYSVEALLEAANTPVSSSGGGQKVVIVLLIILLIAAVAAAAFFFLRWKDTEGLVDELREQNRRRRTTPRKENTPSSGTRPSSAQQPRQAAYNTQTKPRQTGTEQTRTQQSVQNRTQQTAKTRPAGSGSSVSSKPAAPTLTPKTSTETATAAGAKTQTQTQTQPRPQSKVQQKSTYDSIDLDDLDLDDLPNTDDIVRTTRTELKRKQDEPMAKPKTRKSRNFLDDDDDEDLEFDFLKLDDDE